MSILMPKVSFEDIPFNAKVSFIDVAFDFSQIDKHKLITQRVNCKFSDLIFTANQWLAHNAQWRVIGCETENGNESEYIGNDYLRLRLWIKRVEEFSKDMNYQVLKCRSFVPLKPNEGLESLISEVNQRILLGDIDGKIITVETMFFDSDDDLNVDVEEPCIIYTTNGVIGLRIFYEQGKTCRDQIGLMDFVPEVVKAGGFFSKPKFEPNSKVFARASEWLSRNPEVVFINSQSMEMNMKLSAINTRKTVFRCSPGDYIRFLRIAYLKSIEGDSCSALPPPPPLYMETRIIKCDLSAAQRKILIAELFERYEWVAPIKDRWHLMDIETVEIWVKNESDFEEGVEKSYNDTKTDDDKVKQMFIRIYYDVGYFARRNPAVREVS